LDEPPSYSILFILSGNNLLYLFITVILLFLAGLLSATEAALFSLKSADIDKLRNGADMRGKIVAQLLSQPRLLLSSLTAWKYVMLISSSVLFAIAILFADSTEVVIEVFVITIAFAFFGVILPKIYGTENNVRIALKASKSCMRLLSISKPFTGLLLRIANRVEKQWEKISEQNAVKELAQALELAAADKETTEDEKEILKGIVNFGTLTVKQVMRPRNEINSVEIALNFHDLLIYIKKSGFSRIPVYRETLDHIEGILYIKDLLPFLEEDKKFAWTRLLRPAYFIPENKKIDQLLKEFQEKRVHIALVVDEFGGTAGIITLEDLIEEIIGDIHDEFDEVGAYYKKLDEKTFVVDSKIPVHEFCRLLDIEPAIFDFVKGDNETLGGLLLEIHHDLPKIGDQIQLDPITFVIEAVDHKRIKKIRVHINEQKEN
jgi:putative hemolysin